VFQDPHASLNPRQRIGDILQLPFRIHRQLSAAERREKVDELLERVGLAPARDFATKLPHQLSGGQRQRVAIARAIALKPRLLIADEPVSALDVSISGQILNLLRNLQEEIGSSMLFISHDLGLVQATCDRVLVLHRGRIVESGPTAAVLGNPAHPYTLQLMASMPAYMAAEQLAADEEAATELALDGCLFRDRCPFAFARCRQSPPSLEEAPGHRSRCWLLDKDADAPGWRDARSRIASRVGASAGKPPSPVHLS
jgi:oligopeptide/dipeptide ABC transporter ATP-binding protein